MNPEMTEFLEWADRKGIHFSEHQWDLIYKIYAGGRGTGRSFVIHAIQLFEMQRNGPRGYDPLGKYRLPL